VRLALHQTRYDLLTFVRTREAVFFTVMLPVIFLVIFATVLGNGDVHVAGHRVSQTTYYVPQLMALAITSAALQSLVFAVVTQRELGMLKRRRATPVAPSALIAGRTATAVAVSYADVAVLWVIGRVFYGVSFPVSALPAILVTVGVGAAALCCVGYAVSTLIRSEESATPILQATILPLYFISGVFFPQDSVPGWLLGVADAFPIRHLAVALLRAYDPLQGGFAWGHLGIVVAWGAAGLLVAVARFKWVPQAR
jgi:ABC-2 type transport system permease protein